MSSADLGLAVILAGLAYACFRVMRLNARRRRPDPIGKTLPGRWGYRELSSLRDLGRREGQRPSRLRVLWRRLRGAA